LAESSSATFSSIAMSNGSIFAGLRHVPSFVTGAGASTTGFTNAARFAFACAAA
jgi:hypothetical protein